MHNLFRGGWHRICKSKPVRVELLLAFLLPVLIIINGYFQTNITNAYVYKLIARFFGYAPMVGLFVAIFSGWLWGTEYESGTLRNKFFCGRNRARIYLSYLLLCIFIALSVAAIWLIVNLLLGIPLLGTLTLTLTNAQLVICILSSLLMAVALACLCCMLASLVNNKAGSILLCLGLVVALIIVGIVLYGRFSEPEISMNIWVWESDDPSVKWHPENERYVGGMARILLELVICILPGAQGVLLLEQAVEHYAVPAIGSLITIAITTAAGIYFFEKKDLR